MIELQRVCKSFDGDSHAVLNLDLTVSAGELLALLGGPARSFDAVRPAPPPARLLACPP